MKEMRVVEKIKQIFEKEAIDEELQPEEIERRVLKILAVHREKLQELADLLKNRPKTHDKKYQTHHGFHIHYNRDLDKWVEVFGKKFGEMIKEEK